jgi:hypothetical protein
LILALSLLWFRSFSTSSLSKSDTSTIGQVKEFTEPEDDILVFYGSQTGTYLYFFTQHAFIMLLIV